MIFHLLFILYLPFFIHKLFKRGIQGGDYGERFGIFSKNKIKALAEKSSPVWIHAVSVGEVIAALSFISLWKEKDPEIEIILSTTTTTGQAIALKKVPEDVIVIFSPLDFLWVVKRFLKLIKPKLLIIFEVEIWPNLIRQSSLKGIRLALVNCRMSDSSSRGYSRHRWFFKTLFNSFDLICTQSEDDTMRVRNITGETGTLIKTCNTMKFDQVPNLNAEDKSEIIKSLFDKNALILVAASTHPGEEAMILNVYTQIKKKHNKIGLILVPRHCERTPQIENIIKDANLSYLKYEGDSLNRKTDVLLINTTGELINFFAISDIVYVGKSMAGNKGGHNIIEPALFSKTIIHGPEMQNFRLVVDIFQKNEASIEVKDERELTKKIDSLIQKPSLRKKYALNAGKVVKQNKGAINKTLQLLFNN